MPWFYSPRHSYSSQVPDASNSFFFPYYHPPVACSYKTPLSTISPFVQPRSSSHRLETLRHPSTFAPTTPEDSLYSSLSELSTADLTGTSVVLPHPLVVPSSSPSRRLISASTASMGGSSSRDALSTTSTPSKSEEVDRRPVDAALHPPQQNEVQDTSASCLHASPPRSTSSPPSSSFRRLVTVLSFNVLSQSYLVRHQSELYSGHSPSALRWENRRHLIIEEILDQAPDVVCLQEVETPHYHDFFEPVLTQSGFVGVFHPRCLDRSKPDGVAIFYRGDKFHLLERHPVNMNKGAGILTRDNVALVLVLEPIVNVEKVDGEGEEGFIVALVGTEET